MLIKYDHKENENIAFAVLHVDVNPVWQLRNIGPRPELIFAHVNSSNGFVMNRPFPLKDTE